MIDEARIAARMPTLHRLSGRALLVLSGYMLVYGGWKFLVLTFAGAWSAVDSGVAMALQLFPVLWLGMFGVWVVSGQSRVLTDDAGR